MKEMDFKTSNRIRIATAAMSLAAGFSVAFWGYTQFYPKYAFHTFLSLAIIISCVGPAILFHMHHRRKNMIDNSLPRLLEDIAESQETGMTLLQSLEESSRRNYGPLNDELRKMVAELSWGTKFEDAFQAFVQRVQTELTEKVATLILQAVYLGGDLKSIFRSTAEFTRKMLDIRKERNAQLRQYVFTIYTIMIIFLVIVVVLYQSFFVPFSTGGKRFLILATSPENFKGILFDLATVEAIAGGLIAGKLSEGTVSLGLKHSVVLLFISLLVFTFYL